MVTGSQLVGEEVYLRPLTADDIVNTHHWFLQSDPQARSCRPLPFLTAQEAADLLAFIRSLSGNDPQEK